MPRVAPGPVLPFTAATLTQLAQEAEADTLTIAMPVLVDAGAREDHLRLRHLVHDGLERLAQRSMSRGLLQERAEALAHIDDEPSWWQHQAPGLLIVASGRGVQLFRLPEPVPEQVAVGTGPHLCQAVSCVRPDARYHLLALEKHGAHLFAASRHDLREIPLPHAPPSIEAMGWDLGAEHHMRFNSMHSSGGAGQYATSNGHDLERRRKDRLREYCRAVDQAVLEVVGGEALPLVLCGLEYELGQYRLVSRHPRIHPEPVEMHPEAFLRQSPSRQCAHAWSIAASMVGARLQEQLEELPALAVRGRARTDIEGVLEAAHERRLGTVWVDPSRRSWGVWDDGRLTALPAGDPRADDLLGTAVRLALAQQAEVWAVPAERLPAHAALAGVLRW